MTAKTSPAWINERRRGLLRRLRRERARDDAQRLSAGERYELSCALLALGEQIDPPPARRVPDTDEPPELWLRLLARFRAVAPARTTRS